MKRFTQMIAAAALLGLTGQVQAQGVRQNVLVEVFTGTWCQYCPGAAMGVDDLLLNGKSIAPVKYHFDDPYETTESLARDNYYAVSGYPTTEFDGGNEIAGGSTNTSIYAAYLPEYNTAMGTATPFNITATHNLSSDSLFVNYTFDQVGTYSAGNLVAHVVVTERNIPDVWLGGLTEVDYVMRKMYPNENGTAVTISQGNPFSGAAMIVLDPSWVKANMEVVVFLQNSTTKQVFNAFRAPIMASQYNVDPEASMFTNPFTDPSCQNTITPEVIIYNNGNTTLTSLDINYNLNGTTGTYTWTGTLPYYSSAIVTLPTLTFTVQANNSLSISVANPNTGATDENSANNNYATSTWQGVSTTYNSGNYTFELQLDRWGTETTWEFYDENNAVIASGGPYTNTPQANPLPALITQSIPYPGAGCVRFRIYDAYGDGICCQYGNGYYNLYNANGTLISNGSNFNEGAGLDWVLDGVVASRDITKNEAVEAFPNPNNGRFTLTLGQDIVGATNIEIMTLAGKKVFSTSVEGNTYEANISDMAAGMYLVRVENSNGVAIKKITKE